MSLLELTHVPPRLWQAFQAGAAELPTKHPVVERWRRALLSGVSPDGSKESHELIRGGALRERISRSATLLRGAGRCLDSEEVYFEDAHFSLLLTDSEGVILSARAGGEFRETARRLNLLEGGRWGEEIQGTNAIGTALTEGRPVSVVGSGHFVRSNHELVCYASPIHDPYGEVIGVLDVTSHAAAADARHQRAVIAGARRIEEALRQEAWGSPGAGVMSVLLETSATPALLVEWPGVVRGANPGAQRLLKGRTLGCNLQSILGIGWDRLKALVDGGHSRVDLKGEGGALGERRLRLRGIQGGSGSTLGVIIFIEGSPAPLKAHITKKRLTPTPSEAKDPFSALFGEDPALLETKALAARIAPSRLPVLLLATTGTGKGLLAKAIHQASRRALGPLVHLNCGALSPQLLESELFGYGPGAFTGAKREGAEGKIHSAAGGTLFLDEVGAMPPRLQAMLLKVLEEGTYYRIGESTPRQADIRLISATCEDLAAMIKAGTFREDLYYRLRGVTLSLPPLKERQDIIELAQALIHTLAQEEPAHHGEPPSFSPAAAQAILAYPWPGNVRELRMTLHLALTLTLGPEIQLSDLPQEVQHFAPDSAPTPSPAPTLNMSKRERLLATLARRAGNVSAVARELGVSRSTIYRMLERYDIQVKRAGLEGG